MRCPKERIGPNTRYIGHLECLFLNGGRIPIGSGLRLKDHPCVFAVGDTAAMTDGLLCSYLFVPALKCEALQSLRFPLANSAWTLPELAPTLSDETARLPVFRFVLLLKQPLRCTKVQFKICDTDVMFHWVNASIGQPPLLLTDPRDKNQRK